jgi:hypothetical protein
VVVGVGVLEQQRGWQADREEDGCGGGERDGGDEPDRADEFATISVSTSSRLTASLMPMSYEEKISSSGSDAPA